MTSVVSKEKIMALSLDIEDKEKVIILLERKVESARSQLSDLDDLVSQRFQRITQVSVVKYFVRIFSDANLFLIFRG